MTIHKSVRAAVMRAYGLFPSNSKELRAVLVSSKTSMRSLRRFLAAQKATGSFEPTRQRAPVQGAVSAADWAALADILKLEPWLYKREMAAALLDETGSFYTVRQIRQALDKNHYTRRVIQFFSKQQNAALVAHFEATVANTALFPADVIVFSDATHCKEKSKRRTRGWGPAGARVTGTASPPGLDRISSVAALSIEGMMCVKTVDIRVDGQVTSDVIMDFLNNHLLPLMQPYPAPASVLVLDNARVHVKHLITAACAAVGVLNLFLPPYSPQLNPIEQVFNCAKMKLQANWGTPAGMLPLVQQFEDCLFAAVTPESACRHFRDCSVPVSAELEAWACR